MSCELGFKETTEPTGGTQNREHRGGPTNGRAAACRRRLAAKAHPRPTGRGAALLAPPPSFPVFLLAPRHPHPAGLSAPITSSVPFRLICRATTIFPTIVEILLYCPTAISRPKPLLPSPLRCPPTHRLRSTVSMLSPRSLLPVTRLSLELGAKKFHEQRTAGPLFL